MSRLARVAGLVAVIVPLAACADDREPSVLPSGIWGGDHVRLDVDESGSRIEFDCAHGSVAGAWRLDSDGRFAVAGVFVREHGGPVRSGEEEDLHPATYSGRLDGLRVTLWARLDDGGATAGPFSAVLGQPARVFKCL